MNNTSTGIFRNEGSRQHLEATIFCPSLEIVEQRLISLADQSGTLELFHYCMFFDFSLLEDVVKAIFHANVNFLRIVIFPSHVVEFWIHSHGKIAG